MTDSLLQVDDLSLALRRSPRRKTVQITVERDGQLLLVAPPDVDEERLRQFVLEKRFWIYTRLAEKEQLQKTVPVFPTTQLPAMGCHPLTLPALPYLLEKSPSPAA